MICYEKTNACGTLKTQAIARKHWTEVYQKMEEALGKAHPREMAEITDDRIHLLFAVSKPEVLHIFFGCGKMPVEDARSRINRVTTYARLPLLRVSLGCKMPENIARVIRPPNHSVMTETELEPGSSRAPESNTLS